MEQNYIIRRAESAEDSSRLNELFTEIFYPQEVGILAETIFNSFPRMKKDYWFIAEDKESSAIAAAFALLPWTWEMDGIRLCVAEMGIVGTRQEHRKKGIMRMLNREFFQTVEKERFDLAVIQGIPGFYHRLGFHYSIPLDNHIHIPLHLIPGEGKGSYTFRTADMKDIPFLMQEDETYRESFFLSMHRSEENWKYLLTDSRRTEYGSEFYIMNHPETNEKYCFRIPFQGFGKGLIVSEISEGMSCEALDAFFIFCKQKAVQENKPYIRLNLHNESVAAKAALAMGVEKGKPYAWQIRIPDNIRLLRKMIPIFEKRMKNSCFHNFTGTFRLDFFQEQTDMKWIEGRLDSVTRGGEEECGNTFCINADMFPVLCLGHRSWQELQYNRPDIFPASQYIRPEVSGLSEKSGLLADILFPARKSWIYEQY